MGLTDAQKHRLTSHSKKTFWGASSSTVPGAKKKGFVRTQELIFLVSYFWFFNRGHQAGGPLTNCFVYEGFLTVFPNLF